MRPRRRWPADSGEDDGSFRSRCPRGSKILYVSHRAMTDRTDRNGAFELAGGHGETVEHAVLRYAVDPLGPWGQAAREEVALVALAAGQCANDLKVRRVKNNEEWHKRHGTPASASPADPFRKRKGKQLRHASGGLLTLREQRFQAKLPSLGEHRKQSNIGISSWALIKDI